MSSKNIRMKESLEFLLKVKSKRDVVKYFNKAFLCRASPTTMNIDGMAAELEISTIEAGRLAEALVLLVKTVLKHSGVDPARELLETRAQGLEERLATLILQVLQSQLPDWLNACVMQRPSLPKLVGVKWRCDMKTASDQVSRMSVPSVLVSLNIEDQPKFRDDIPTVKNVEFELSKEALHTMVDGLHRIRDQLGSVVKG